MAKSSKPQVDHAQYWSRLYNTKERFCSFWHQLDETLDLAPRTVLEVGPGSGLVTDWLRRAGIEVTTVDIDTDVRPDVVASVTSLPVAPASYDVVLCCEVMEHLPWPDAVRALAELRRVSRLGAVVSLPDVTPWVGKAYPLYFGLYADTVRRQFGRGLHPFLQALRRRVRFRDVFWTHLVPARFGIGGKTFQLKRPPVPHRPWSHEFDGEHYWEIGTEGYPVARVREAMTRAGFRLEREFRVPENPWHRFFVLLAG
jgi:SAM-dependent methyltransferase